MKAYGEAKVDMTLPEDDNIRNSTRIHGDAESVCFETSDHEGNEVGDSWELTWEEIYAAVKEWKG